MARSAFDWVPQDAMGDIVAALLAVLVGVGIAVVLGLQNPLRWLSAVAVGCGVTSVSLAVLAMRIGAKRP